MPRGVRKAVEAGNAQADSLAPSAQYTAQKDSVIASAGRVSRSRDEEEADRIADEFLKNNRAKLVGFEKRLPDVPDRPGWVRRYVNDMNGRVQSLMERGWRLVPQSMVPAVTDSIGRGNTDIGGAVSIVTNAGEGPMRVVLMEVPKKLFDMQMDAIHEQVRRTEEAIRQGRNGLEDATHVYKPKWADNRIETPQ